MRAGRMLLAFDLAILGSRSRHGFVDVVVALSITPMGVVQRTIIRRGAVRVQVVVKFKRIYRDFH